MATQHQLLLMEIHYGLFWYVWTVDWTTVEVSWIYIKIYLYCWKNFGERSWRNWVRALMHLNQSQQSVKFNSNHLEFRFHLLIDVTKGIMKLNVNWALSVFVLSFFSFFVVVVGVAGIFFLSFRFVSFHFILLTWMNFNESTNLMPCILTHESQWLIKPTSE